MILSRFRQRLLTLLIIVLMALSVRLLTVNFLQAHLDDPGWFPNFIYASFDRVAQDWLDGRAPIFWIDDPTRTERVVYPPGYPAWLALIYRVTGSRSPITVQKVQAVLDAFAVILIVGIGVSAFGWSVGFWAGAIVALWPLMATYAGIPLADMPTNWIVLGATWMLLLAAKRRALAWALGAGVLVGLSCWFRANAVLLPFFWMLALMLFAQTNWRRRVVLGLSLLLVALLSIAPIVIRNAIVFHAFVPPGLGTGTNLLEGIGETERGSKEFGMPATDRGLTEQERAEKNPDAGQPFELYYPDGIQRDRERTKKALAIIVRHPFWYAGAVVERIAGVLKYAGKPNGIYGTAGINVTSKKCLSPAWQGGAVALLVNGLGMLQSVLRYLLLPLMIVGVVLAFRLDWRVTALLMTSVVYYLVVGSLMHTHVRYGLPMQAILTIFAGLTLSRSIEMAKRKIGRRVIAA